MFYASFVSYVCSTTKKLAFMWTIGDCIFSLRHYYNLLFVNPTRGEIFLRLILDFLLAQMLARLFIFRFNAHSVTLLLFEFSSLHLKFSLVDIFRMIPALPYQPAAWHTIRRRAWAVRANPVISSIVSKTPRRSGKELSRFSESTSMMSTLCWTELYTRKLHRNIYFIELRVSANSANNKVTKNWKISYFTVVHSD